MDFQTAIKTCFRKYATFSGRATRPEFWWFALFLVVGHIVLGWIDDALFHTVVVETGRGFISYVNIGGPLEKIFSFATLIPALAVGARRLHDTNRSGWWQLLYVIPLFGMIVLLIFFVQGPRDQNRFAAPGA